MFDPNVDFTARMIEPVDKCNGPFHAKIQSKRMEENKNVKASNVSLITARRS
jgi:hypothetical protein